MYVRDRPEKHLNNKIQKKLKVLIDWNLIGIINDQFKNILLIQGRDM